jgi:hypothetical protein
MRKLVFMLGSTALLAAQIASAAPKATAPGPDAVSAYGASIPDRPYYPPGYRDLRIAAAAQVATFPRTMDYMVSMDLDGKPGAYDVIDCNAEHFDTREVGPDVAVQSELALEIARIGGELRRLGYRAEIFEEPLLAYEREALAGLPASIAERAADNPPMGEAGTESGQAEPLPEPAPEPSAAETDSGQYRDMTEAELAATHGPIGLLALEMDKRRARLQPDKAPIIVEGGCGAGEAAFLIRAAPANGKVWIVNAFAFHVCMTKVPDPWDLRACRWTEVDPDNATMASGRYMYQARWPDGKTSRGARVFEGDFDSDAPSTITIRR